MKHSSRSTAHHIFHLLETRFGVSLLPTSLVALIERSIDTSAQPFGVLKLGTKLGDVSWTGKLGDKEVVVCIDHRSLPLLSLDELLLRLRFETPADDERWLFVYSAPDPAWLRNNSSLVLGLTKQGHDSAASIIDIGTGKILGFCQEERISRIRHERRFPARSINEVLKQANVSILDVGAITVAHGLWWYTDLENSSAPYAEHFARLPLAYSKPDLPARNSVTAFRENLRKALGIERSSPLPPLYFINHHLSHVFASMTSLDRDEPGASIAVVVDGRGEWETTTAWIIDKEEVRQLFHEVMPNSLGYFYNSFGWIFGWRYYGFEGRLMGLAPYGTAKNSDERDLRKKLQILIRRILPVSSSGYHINQEFLRGGYSSARREEHLRNNWWLSPFRLSTHVKDELTALVPPLSQDEDIMPYSTKYRPHSLLANVLQQALSDAMVNVCDRALDGQAEVKHLLLSGGVAHNASCNGIIARRYAARGIKTLVPPYVSDEGLAIGAPAVLSWALGMSRVQTKTAHLGISYTDNEFSNILSQYDVLDSAARLKTTDRVDVVSEELRRGRGVAVFLGRSECGARALGGRSILLPAHCKGSLDLANYAKARASWRPVALAVLEHRQQELFKMATGSPFMNICVEPSGLAVKQLLSGLHPADRTTRVQVVSRTSSPFLYQILLGLEKNEIYALINTSFNRKEPIVHTPAEALDTFYYLSGVESFLIGPYWISGRRFKPGLLRASEEPSISVAYKEFLLEGNPLSLLDSLLSIELLGHQPYLILSKARVGSVPLLFEFYSETIRKHFVSALKKTGVGIEIAPGAGHEELVRQFMIELFPNTDRIEDPKFDLLT